LQIIGLAPAASHVAALATYLAFMKSASVTIEHCKLAQRTTKSSSQEPAGCADWVANV